MSSNDGTALLLSDQLQRFIRNTLKSVWDLELLLLLSRDRTRTWSPGDLNRELRGSLSLVNDVLAKLQQAGLVMEESGGRYRYGPATGDLEQAVHDLEAAYAARPLAVVKAVLAAPNEKIQTFADAFKVKKD